MGQPNGHPVIKAGHFSSLSFGESICKAGGDGEHGFPLRESYPWHPPHTVRAVKHGWSIYHPSCIRWGKKKCLVLKLFWHQIYDSLWSEEKITTWTYLKLLASPVSFVARNVCKHLRNDCFSKISIWFNNTHYYRKIVIKSNLKYCFIFWLLE